MNMGEKRDKINYLKKEKTKLPVDVYFPKMKKNSYEYPGFISVPYLNFLGSKKDEDANGVIFINNPSTVWGAEIITSEERKQLANWVRENHYALLAFISKKITYKQFFEVMFESGKTDSQKIQENIVDILIKVNELKNK